MATGLGFVRKAGSVSFQLHLDPIGSHTLCPWQESNLHLVLRRDLLYPLSYRGSMD